jgi:hypothetical protein
MKSLPAAPKNQIPIHKMPPEPQPGPRGALGSKSPVEFLVEIPLKGRVVFGPGQAPEEPSGKRRRFRAGGSHDRPNSERRFPKTVHIARFS